MKVLTRILHCFTCRKMKKPYRFCGHGKARGVCCGILCEVAQQYLTHRPGSREPHRGTRPEGLSALGIGLPIKMLLETRRPASPAGRVHGRREKHVGGCWYSIPIGASGKTKLPAVETETCECLIFYFEFLTQSGSFWLPPAQKVRTGGRK